MSNSEDLLRQQLTAAASRRQHASIIRRWRDIALYAIVAPSLLALASPFLGPHPARYARSLGVPGMVAIFLPSNKHLPCGLPSSTQACA